MNNSSGNGLGKRAAVANSRIGDPESRQSGRRGFAGPIGASIESSENEFGLSAEDISDIINSKSCYDPEEIDRVNEIELHRSFGPDC